MTRRKRIAITISSLLLIVVLSVVGFRSCGSRKAAQQTPATDQPVTASMLKGVEAAITTAINGLTSRVETLEKASLVPVDDAAVKALDRKVEKLNGEVGGLGERILKLEEPVRPSATVQQEEPTESEEEQPLTDAEAERRFIERLKSANK